MEWCPECQVELDPNRYCKNCECTWTMCPDCGELFDKTNDEWDDASGTCSECAQPGDIALFVNPASEQFYDYMKRILRE